MMYSSFTEFCQLADDMYSPARRWWDRVTRAHKNDLARLFAAATAKLKAGGASYKDIELYMYNRMRQHHDNRRYHTLGRTPTPHEWNNYFDDDHPVEEKVRKWYEPEKIRLNIKNARLEQAVHCRWPWASGAHANTYREWTYWEAIRLRGWPPAGQCWPATRTERW